MSYFTPRIPRTESWQKTLGALAQIFGKKKLATDETFVWQDFDPRVDWGGMTATSINVRNARYMLLGKICFFCFDANAILAAPFNIAFNFLLPDNIISATGQSDICSVTNALVTSAGIWLCPQGTNQVVIYNLPIPTAFGAGYGAAQINAFIEVT